MKPALFTFDIFGTVLDWRRGLGESLARRGVALGESFDAIVDRQGALERGEYQTYRRITAQSLVDVLGIDPEVADAVGREVGTWPPFADSPIALESLMKHTPCAALSNSDRTHGEDAQRGLGLRLSRWLSAEDTRVYKPNPAFWEIAQDRFRARFDRSWWHVSAYADYDLEAARRLGLTTVFVQRPHCRPGKADFVVSDLAELAVRASA